MEDYDANRKVKQWRERPIWGTPATLTTSSTSGVQQQTESICFTGATPATKWTSAKSIFVHEPLTTPYLGYSPEEKKPTVLLDKYGRRRNKPKVYETITPTVEAYSGKTEKSDSELFQFGSRPDKSESFDFKFNTGKSTERNKPIAFETITPTVEANSRNSEKSDSELFQFDSRPDKSECFDFKFNTGRSTKHSEVYAPPHIQMTVENIYIRLNFVIATGKKEAVIQFLKDNKITPEDYYNKEKSSRNMELKCVALAAQWGHSDVVNSLINLGFDPDEKGYRDLIPVRPIHLACEFGHLAVVKTLIENHGVKVEAKFGETSIVHHVQMKISKHIYKYLIEEHDFSVNITDNSGVSLLHLAAKNNDEAFCKYLLDQGADPNISLNVKPTPLALAVSNRQIQIVRLLLGAGAEVNVKTSEGDPVLMAAVRVNDYELAKIFFSYGTDPDIPDGSGQTPLYFIIEHFNQSNYKFLRLLLCDMNASLDIPNKEGETAFDVVVRRRNYSIIQLFADTGYDTTSVTKRLKDLSEDALKNEDAASLLAVLGRPRSLFELTCFKIRSVLRKTLPKAVRKLPIPMKVQGALMLDYIPKEK